MSKAKRDKKDKGKAKASEVSPLDPQGNLTEDDGKAEHDLNTPSKDDDLSPTKEQSIEEKEEALRRELDDNPDAHAEDDFVSDSDESTLVKASSGRRRAEKKSSTRDDNLGAEKADRTSDPPSNLFTPRQNNETPEHADLSLITI